MTTAPARAFARTELAPGVTVDVYNLHADAGGHERDEAARQDNFAQLAEFILEHSAGQAVIVGGDTNLKIANPDRPLDAQVWSDFRHAVSDRQHTRRQSAVAPHVRGMPPRRWSVRSPRRDWWRGRRRGT